VSATPKAETLRRALLDRWEECRPHPFDPAKPRILLHEPTFGAEEIGEALDCLLSTYVTMGKRVLRFEKEFGQLFGFAHAGMVNSGSSANLLAVAALSNPAFPDRLKPGDEVIVPALSWSTTVWPLVQHGLVPVVVDIDPRTFDIDPNEVERAVGPKTRGIMPVHVYGNPCAMDALTSLAERRSLILIEDCCESLGATFGGRSVGTFGKVGTFSFYYSHHITTLEGGMVATSDFELAELMRTLRAHGWIRENEDKDRHLRAHPGIDPKFLFVNQGYNLRPTELQGAFGSVQLGKLDAFVRIRASNADYWRREFEPWQAHFQIQEPTRGGQHSWFGFPMAVREGAPFSAKELCAHLATRGIETRPLICGNIAAQPGMQYYAHRVVGDLAKANHLMKSGFTFGNHQMVDERAREYITRSMREFVAK
jgi:CDP-4-dehydro-6-deoxyglucose reductase, E1